MNQDAEQTTVFPSSPPPSGTNPLSGLTPTPSESRLRQPTLHGDLEQLTENYRSRPNEAYSPEQSITSQIAALETWARAISAKEKTDAWRTWALKGIAFFGAVAGATAGVLAYPRVSIAAGVVTAIAVAVDAAWPISGEAAARRRAVHDLRELQHTLKLKWDKVRLAYPDPLAVKRVAHALALLDSTQNKREEIGRYLGEASPTANES